VLLGSASLSLASAPATAGPENLRALIPVLEAQLKEWLTAWRAVLAGLKVEQFKNGLTGQAVGHRSLWRSGSIQEKREMS